MLIRFMQLWLKAVPLPRFVFVHCGCTATLSETRLWGEEGVCLTSLFTSKGPRTVWKAMQCSGRWHWSRLILCMSHAFTGFVFTSGVGQHSLTNHRCRVRERVALTSVGGWCGFFLFCFFSALTWIAFFSFQCWYCVTVDITRQASLLPGLSASLSPNLCITQRTSRTRRQHGTECGSVTPELWHQVHHASKALRFVWGDFSNVPGLVADMSSLDLCVQCNRTFSATHWSLIFLAGCLSVCFPGSL